MTARPDRLPTAAEYARRVEDAIRRQSAFENKAARLESQPLDPSDPAAEELRNAVRQAALLEAGGYRQYAKHNEDLRADAAAYEAGVVTPLRFGQDERRARYDADDVA